MELCESGIWLFHFLAELPVQKTENSDHQLMISRFISRIFYGSLVMLGVVVIVFFLFQGFGDPARLILGQRADAGTLNNIRKDLYLDQPKWKQFVYYLNDVSPISIYSETELTGKKYSLARIGRKYKTGFEISLSAPFLPDQENRFGPCLWKHYPALLFWLFWPCLSQPLSGMALGILAAVKKDTWMDTTAIFTSVLGISAPSFFMSIVIAYIFGFVLNQYTGLQMTGSLFDTDPFTGRQWQLTECDSACHYTGYKAHGYYRPTNHGVPCWIF